MTNPQDQPQAERYNRLSAELRYTKDPIEAFNRFIELEVDPSLRSHFADSDDNNAEFVRRIINQSAHQRALELLDELDKQWVDTEPYELFDKVRTFIEAKRLNLTKGGE